MTAISTSRRQRTRYRSTRLRSSGMAGRFPGADSVSAFWRNLRRDEESIVTLSEDELLAAGVTERPLAILLISGARRSSTDRRIRRGVFGFTPQAARMMDPQHRLFMQCAWHALEDAGYDPAEIEGSIGVYGTAPPAAISSTT